METSLKVHVRSIGGVDSEITDHDPKKIVVKDDGGAYQNAVTGLIEPHGQAHAASGGRVPQVWGIQFGEGAGLPLESAKEKIGAKLTSPIAAERRSATAYLDRHARALKHGYPGEGETEGAREFKDYLSRTMEKDGFTWDILRLDKRAGANVNLFSPENGGLYGAIEQGFAKKGVDPETAAAFFQGTIEHLKSQGARFVLMELNDPRRMDEEKKQEDDLRTRYRVDNAVYMAGLGMRSPDARYGQITLNPGDEPVVHLKLGLVPTDPSVTSISSEEFLAIVKGYFSTFKIVRDEAARLGVTPGEVVEHNETYREIAASVAGRATLSLQDPRTDWKLSQEDYSRWNV